MEVTSTQVRLLKDHGSFKAGALVEVDGDPTELIEKKIAELYDPEAERRAAEAAEQEDEKFNARLEKLVARVVAQVVDKDQKDHLPRIELGVDRATLDPMGGFKSFAEHAQAVWKAGNPDQRGPVDPRLKVAGEMAESDDSQGGYLVPTQFRAQLLEIVHELSDIIGRCFPIPMQTNRITIPAIAETSRVDGSRHGGLSVYWVNEAGQKLPSKPILRQVTLSLHKVAGLIHVSDELLSDSPISVEAIIKRLFAEELMFVLTQSFIRGTGVGQPLGILNAACLVTQAAEVPQAAATIVFNNINRMWSRMWGPYRKNGIWLINQDAEPELGNMALAVGTGGGPAYLPAGGLSASPYATLLGRPVFQSECCSTLGTVGDIIFADFSQYLYGRKTTGIETATSMHYRFIYDQQSFRFVLRADGQPWWDSALTPKHGDNTMSPFVALATRP